MDKMIFRKLEMKDCERIRDINPSQFIGRAWREIDGKRILVDINFQDTDWPNGYEYHYKNLKNTLLNSGVALGAFDDNNKLLGFLSVNRKFFGAKYNYVLLDQLFITLEYRNNGLGKKLFMLCVNEAKEWNADKIYICAGSSEETIGFYKKIGCIETEELQLNLHELDPRDLHLEFDLCKA